MDAEDPAPDLKYKDIHGELFDHGLDDIIKINSLPLELLATFGCLGLGGARSLQRYAQEKLLRPLGLLDIMGGSDSSIEVLPADWVAVPEGVAREEAAAVNLEDVAGSVARPASWGGEDSEDAPSRLQQLGRGRDDILEWLDDVTQRLSEIEEVDEEEVEVDEVEEVSSEGWRDRASQEV